MVRDVKLAQGISRASRKNEIDAFKTVINLRTQQFLPVQSWWKTKLPIQDSLCLWLDKVINLYLGYLVAYEKVQQSNDMKDWVHPNSFYNFRFGEKFERVTLSLGISTSLSDVVSDQISNNVTPLYVFCMCMFWLTQQICYVDSQLVQL